MHNPVERAHSGAPLHSLIDFGRQFYNRGWMEGTGGNLSVKLKADPLEILITPSGLNKGYLATDDLLTVNAQGFRTTEKAKVNLRPSFETPIHQAIYRAVPRAGAVFHVHPVYAVVLSGLYGHPEETRGFPVKWMEILKAIGFPEGQDAEFPVLANWQDTARVGENITTYLGKTKKPVPGFMLYNHGLTVWGKDVEEARNHLEVMEYVCKILYLKLQTN